MPVPNLASLYQRINSGSEGGQEFARFINLLFHADAKDDYQTYESHDDSSGDFKGVDAIQYSKDEFQDVVTAFQFKFYPKNLLSGQRSSIKSSLINAKNKCNLMGAWVLVTPEDWLKKDMDWFETLKSEFESNFRIERNGLVRNTRFSLIHFGHTQIIELALKHPHIGREYFPELYKDIGGLLQLNKLDIDKLNSNWRQFKHGANRYYQTRDTKNSDISSDPIFDVQIINNTDDIFLINEIKIDVENVWSTLKGIPLEHLLKSIGTVLVDVDFSKRFTSRELSDPLIINSKSPFRFKIQLTKFAVNAPGNWATISIILKFSGGQELRSKSITLGF